MINSKLDKFLTVAGKITEALECKDTAAAMLCTSILLEGLIIFHKNVDGLKPKHLEMMNSLQEMLKIWNIGGVVVAKKYQQSEEENR